MARDDRATRRMSAERTGRVVMTAAALIGWLWLALTLVWRLETSDAASLGPGMVLLDRFSALGQWPEEIRVALARLCTTAPADGGSVADLVSAFAMWWAMVLAMMLPSAAPALTLTTRDGGGIGASVAVMAGYLAIWTLFAIGMTIAGDVLVAARAMNGPMAAMIASFAATTLLAAGLYQFTPWKRACLIRCRFPTRLVGLPARDPAGLFRRGVMRGLECLGSCWALMAVMLAVGVMNIVWMVGLTAVMALEKRGSGDGIRRLIGVGLVLAAMLVLAQSPAGLRLLRLG